LHSSGAEVLAITGDLRRKKDVHNVFDSVVREYGAIDVLINLAGGGLQLCQDWRQGPYPNTGPRGTRCRHPHQCPSSGLVDTESNVSVMKPKDLNVGRGAKMSLNAWRFLRVMIPLA
jgi:NAD(P)-dependent dehydrogenase (short-subunit alcohol dehydrogenase family)